MEQVILVIHVLLAVSMIGFILLQRSEGGGLGMGGGSGAGMGGMMTARGTGNFLTRTTGILAAAFFGTSLLLAIIASSAGPSSIGDKIEESQKPASAVEEVIEEAPVEPAAPVRE